jgi:hypothetical protein
MWAIRKEKRFSMVTVLNYESEFQIEFQTIAFYSSKNKYIYS